MAVNKRERGILRSSACYFGEHDFCAGGVSGWKCDCECHEKERDDGGE